MTKKLFIVLALVASLFCAAAAHADPEDDAVARVQCEILANIAAQATGEVTLESLQTGPVCGNVPFRIDANTQYIMLAVEASHLFKADDPNSDYAILLQNDCPAEASIVGGNPVPTCLPFVTGLTNIAGMGYAGYGTSFAQMESGQAGHFSNDLLVRATWCNLDDELPRGDYSGYVKIVAQVVDGTI